LDFSRADRDEAPLITSDWAAKAELRDGEVIIREAHPPVRIGRPRKLTTELKRQVTLRIDPVLLETMRAGGKGWQRRAEEALRREYLGKRSLASSAMPLGTVIARSASEAASKPIRKTKDKFAGSAAGGKGSRTAARGKSV